MKNLIRNISISALTLLPALGFSQTDTPCGGGGAPSLTVGATCVNTSGTTVGASYATNANNGGTPSCASPGAPDVWYSFIAPASGNVTISTTAGSITDGGMSLYSGSCPNSFTEVACDDDGGTSLMPEITNGTLTPGATYFIRFWDFSGGTGTFDICITENAVVAPPGSNSTCADPDPVCSGSAITFTSTITGLDAEDDINPGNDYGCLSSSPDPTWYYLEIANSGDLAIDMSAASDIDFAIWGPFADVTTAEANCNSYGAPLDCSFSTSATEEANVTGALVGEVYVLVVTNYAGSVQTISISDAPGNTATTDCSIVPLPVELVNFDGFQFRDENTLSWTTVSELNNDYFVVERSLDGKIWSAFDVIEGQGTTTEITEYESTDSNPGEGTNYYRLKQIDTDGSSQLSDVIAIKANNNISVNLIPNPATSSVVINTNEYFNQIQIVNVQGKVVLSESFNLIRKTSIDINDLEKGVYNVIINTEKGNKIERLVVM